VPGNKFTEREKVTLRRLMSHRAGTTVHGFLGIREGAPLPTIVQILNGDPPANSDPVAVDMIPGSATRYSGGGVLIEQLVTMDVTQASYAALTRALVLEPFGMVDSTFEQPLPPARRTMAASAHDAAGHVYAGNLLVYPEQAAAGLWTTPTDLLRWAIEIAEAAAGKHPELLSQELASSMTQRLERDGPVALGTFVWGEGKGRYYWHGGRSEGYACELLYFPETGQGAAVMTNADLGGSVLRSLLDAIAAEYRWPDYGPQIVDQVDPKARRLDRMVGTYATIKPPAIVLRVSSRGERLFFESDKLGIRSAGIVTRPREVTITSEAMLTLAFALDENGYVQRYDLGDIQLTRQ
jgi:CubicO group peptidase (beta-lactamase class C family)